MCVWTCGVKAPSWWLVCCIIVPICIYGGELSFYLGTLVVQLALLYHIARCHVICWTSGGLCKERWILFDTPSIVSLFSSLFSLSLSLSPLHRLHTTGHLRILWTMTWSMVSHIFVRITHEGILYSPQLWNLITIVPEWVLIEYIESSSLQLPMLIRSNAYLSDSTCKLSPWLQYSTVYYCNFFTFCLL